MVAFTPGGSPFLLGDTDTTGRTELCNPRDTDDTWWFAYGDSLNISPLLAGRFLGNEDTLQIPTCQEIATPVEGLLFLERRSADRQGSDLSSSQRDPAYPLRIGTLLNCSFTGTWLAPDGTNLVTELRKCERYLVCSNTTFGPVVPLGQQCGVPTPAAGPPNLPPNPGGNPTPPPTSTTSYHTMLSTTRGWRRGSQNGHRRTRPTIWDLPIRLRHAQSSRPDHREIRRQCFIRHGCVGVSGSQSLTYSGTSTKSKSKLFLYALAILIPSGTGLSTVPNKGDLPWMSKKLHDSMTKLVSDMGRRGHDRQRPWDELRFYRAMADNQPISSEDLADKTTFLDKDELVAAIRGDGAPA